MEIELKLGGIEVEIKGLQGLFTLAGLALLVSAVAQELTRPAGERTWHGRLWGLVPYDLRPPTVQRFHAALWDPQIDTIFTEHPFGVGWYVNFGALIRRALALPEQPVAPAGKPRDGKGGQLSAVSYG